MILRILRWLDQWFSYKLGEAKTLENQKKTPDYKALIAQAEDVQKNAGYRKTLGETLQRQGIPMASKLLLDMIQLYIAQLETSTFLSYSYQSTMPIPIKNPEKLMFLRFTLYQAGSQDSETHLLRDVSILLIKNQKYESSRLIDEAFEERRSTLSELDGTLFKLTSREELLPLKHVLVKLHERNVNWKKLQKDAAREKVAVDLLENFLGIQQPALPAPEPKHEKKEGGKKPNPLESIQVDVFTTITKPKLQTVGTSSRNTVDPTDLDDEWLDD